MRRIAMIIALLAVVLTVAIWRLPASLVAAQFLPDFARVGQLHQVSGTIWRGGALFGIKGVPSSLALAWQCRPTIAPLGAMCRLNDSLSGTLTVDVLAGRLRAEQLLAALPIQVSPLASVSAASPSVTANFAEIVATQNALAIKGSLRATDATYRVGNLDASLGEVTVECAPASNPMATTCTLSNRGGNARVNGKLQLSIAKAGGEFVLTPANGTPPQRVAF